MYDLPFSAGASVVSSLLMVMVAFGLLGDLAIVMVSPTCRPPGGLPENYIRSTIL